MMKKISLEQIDLSTHEGRLLQSAIIELTTSVHRNQTPYDVIDRLYEIAANTDMGNKDESWPARARNNVYAQIDQLQNFFIREMPDAIREGGAIENAIRLLRAFKGYPGVLFPEDKRRSTRGGEEIPKGRFTQDGCKSVTPFAPFADAIKKAVNEDFQKKNDMLFSLQEAGERVLVAATHLHIDEYRKLEGLLVKIYRHYSGQ